ncbi:MAG: alpha/beta hydrolase [Thermocrispum sp.]
MRAALEAQVEQIIRTGLDLDADLTTVMLSITDGEGWSDAASMTEASRVGADRGNSSMVDAPSNATPEQNKAWWDSLSSAERTWLIAHEPETIGNRKGLPYQARHQANVNRLAIERERLADLLEQKQKEFKAAQSDEYESTGAKPGQLQSEIASIQDKLNAIDVLEEQGAQGNLIMSLDTSQERVRAAVGIGDIDNADYLTVHTPGMNAAVEDNMNRYVDEFAETTEYAERMLDGTGETAGTVVWMDYLPPMLDASEGVEVLSDDRAEAGAKRLAAELEGIQASRVDNPPERLTATGHSYGSLTTTLALRQTDAADAFVSQGSPGWGDDGGTGLKVPSGELYNMRTHDDWVAGSGWHGDSPEYYDGVRQLGTHDATAAGGEPLSGTEGHSGYTIADREKATSEYNTAAVMVGRDDLLIDKLPPREHTDTR